MAAGSVRVAAVSGIVGIVGSGASLHRMRGHLRGLDARGPTAAWEIAGAGFAMGAVAAGATPAGARAGIASGWAVALDGELANSHSLIRELELDENGGASGTLATLLSQTGVHRTLRRMSGDVGLAAVNVETGQLILVRGATGLRPLFVVQTEFGVIFSTNAVSLQRAVHAQPSIEALSQHVALGCVIPPNAPWEGIRALPAGTWLEFGDGGVREFRWTEWAAPVRLGRGNRERFVRSAHYALDGAVRATVAAAGPWAIGLSGGAASAAILACRPPSQPPTIALTVDCGGSEAASAAAKAAGIPWKAVRLNADDIDALLDEAPVEAVLVSPEAVLWHALARAAWQEGVSGLALGVGASASFDPVPVPGGIAGWKHRMRQVAATNSRITSLARPLFADASSTERAAERAAAAVSALPGDTNSPGWAAFAALVAAAPTREEQSLDRWLYDRLWLPERTLRAVDQACAAWGLCPALPFADPSLIRVARLIPDEVHNAGGRASVLADVLVAARGTAASASTLPLLQTIGAWLMRGKTMEESIETMSDVIEGAHILELGKRVAIADPVATRRLWSITMLARWRAAALAAG